jgi:CPA2 family monovalent cation:H+ antiporter-2
MELTTPGILELGLVLLLAAGAGWLARALHLPAVVGYLAVGLALSPFTPGYVADRHQLEFLADVGVVLLLFEVGIEIDLARLRRDHGAVAWLAPLQVVVTTAAGTAILAFLGVPLAGAVLVALGIAMSSSVVVVNITRSGRRTTSSETDATLLGWSIFQDITGVVVAAIVLALAGASGNPLWESAVGTAAFLALVVAVGWLLPHVLGAIHADDLLLIISVGVGLAIAGLGALIAGIPLALAAFVAGLLIEGREAAAVRRRLLPFRDVFAVLFFVLLGTLIDPSALVVGAGWLALLVALLVVAKTAVIALFARVGRLAADARQLSIGLSQAGEFSFVLASAGVALGVISPELYAAVLGAVVISIVGSTVLVRLPARTHT